MFATLIPPREIKNIGISPKMGWTGIQCMECAMGSGVVVFYYYFNETALYDLIYEKHMISTLSSAAIQLNRSVVAGCF